VQRLKQWYLLLFHGLRLVVVCCSWCNFVHNNKLTLYLCVIWEETYPEERERRKKGALWIYGDEVKGLAGWVGLSLDKVSYYLLKLQGFNTVSRKPLIYPLRIFIKVGPYPSFLLCVPFFLHPAGVGTHNILDRGDFKHLWNGLGNFVTFWQWVNSMAWWIGIQTDSFSNGLVGWMMMMISYWVLFELSSFKANIAILVWCGWWIHYGFQSLKLLMGNIWQELISGIT